MGAVGAGRLESVDDWASERGREAAHGEALASGRPTPGSDPVDLLRRSPRWRRQGPDEGSGYGAVHQRRREAGGRRLL